MPRPRTGIGEHGVIRYDPVPIGIRARTYYRDNDGRLRQAEKVRNSKTAAKAALEQAIRDHILDTGAAITANTPLARLTTEFIDSRRALGRSYGTITTYQYAADTITGQLGSLHVIEATPARLQRFLTDLAKDRGHGAAKNARSVLSGALGLAVRNGAIPSNPVRELDRISKHGPVGSVAVPPDQLDAFLEAIAGDQWLVDRDVPAVFALMAAAGLRIGEALALRWDDLDLVENTLHVTGTVIRKKGHGVVRQEFPKTVASARSLIIPDYEVKALAARYEQRLDDLRVFSAIRGGWRDPNNDERNFRQRRDALGWPGISSHSMRKTCATILDNAGLSARAIADYLGHSDPAMTESVYLARKQGTGAAAVALDQQRAGAIRERQQTPERRAESTE